MSKKVVLKAKACRFVRTLNVCQFSKLMVFRMEHTLLRLVVQSIIIKRFKALTFPVKRF